MIGPVSRSVAILAPAVLMQRRVCVCLGSVLLMLAAMGTAGISSAGAAPLCSGAQTQTTSSDGAIVFGSACSDTIAVTSPLVRKVYGGEGNDVIYANSDVELISGGGGDDVIYGELLSPEEGTGVPYVPAPSPSYTPAPDPRPEQNNGGAQANASTYEPIECAEKTAKGEPCYGGPGSQKMEGGEGNDTIFGQRGNDAIFGNGGLDSLYGGIGDDNVFGGANNDLVTGGFGEDLLDGSNGNDLVRGDATGDELKDRGNVGVNTVSFATAASPGFKGPVGYGGFPADANNEERGVSINLNGTGCPGFQACNNSAIFGGGNDKIEAGAFENVIGSPFADLIQGSDVANRIDGGGGADGILGYGGDDTLNGGAEGDYIEGGEGTDSADGEAGTNNCATDVETKTNCQGTEASVTQRDRSKISVGLMVDDLPVQVDWVEPYLLGSNSHDEINVEYTSGNSQVKFKAVGTSATFNVGGDVATKHCSYQATEVTCALPKKPDAILLAGLGADDLISIGGFEHTTSPVLLGGEGNDILYGSGTTEDVLVDGDGAYNDQSSGFKFDDALVNYLGVDNLQGGLGNDLLISGTICEGDTLQGAESGKGDEADRNNASWALLPEASGGIVADLAAGKAGNKSGGECSAGTPSSLLNIDDIEGSNQADLLFGDGNDNSLFLRTGVDEAFGRGGNDFINASEVPQAAPMHDDIGGGDGNEDECKFDEGIDSHSGCEIKIPIKPPEE